MLPLQILQQCCASLQDIVPCCVKIICIPRISHFLSGPAAVVQKQRYFAVRVAAIDPLHIVGICVIHPDQIIIVFVVLAGRPAGALAAGINAVLLEFRAGRRIDRVAASAPDLLRAGGSGGNLEFVFEILFLDLFFYYFPRRRSTNLPWQINKTFIISKILPVRVRFDAFYRTLRTALRGHILPKNRAKIRKCGKSRQIEDVKRSKNVVEIGVFYYRCPCVTLGDLGCSGLEAGRQTGSYLTDCHSSLERHVMCSVRRTPSMAQGTL